MESSKQRISFEPNESHGLVRARLNRSEQLSISDENSLSRIGKKRTSME